MVLGIQKVPIDWYKAPLYIRNKYLDKYYEYRNHSVGSSAVHDEHINIDEVLRFILGVNEKNCRTFHPQDLILTGDVAYKADEQFGNEAKMAVRLANFLSAFLQISDPNEVYSGKRVADKPLTEDQIIGETLALALGNTRIWSAGTYWDRNKFTNRTHFAPFAYKKELNTRKFKVEDLARLNKTGEIYTEKPWFRFLKERWASNFDSLEKYALKINLRYNESGEHSQKYEHFPTYYKAANMNHGYWTTPQFDCQGYVKKWLITYAVPFFGWDSIRVKLEFK